MTSNKIHERAFEFARRIIKLCNRLTERGLAGRHIASELLKCGTSIGANSEEAEDGQTKPDFIAKLCVSRKEARESIYPGFPISLWYRTHRIIRRALISMGSDARNPPRRVTPGG